MSEERAALARRNMAVFDALPKPVREWLAEHPRGIPSHIAEMFVSATGGDAEAAIIAMQQNIRFAD